MRNDKEDPILGRNKQARKRQHRDSYTLHSISVSQKKVCRDTTLSLTFHLHVRHGIPANFSDKIQNTPYTTIKTPY